MPKAIFVQQRKGDLEKVVTYRYDRTLGMYLPTKPAHHCPADQIEIDWDADNLPVDICMKKFLKLKNKYLYVPAEQFAEK